MDDDLRQRMRGYGGSDVRPPERSFRPSPPPGRPIRPATPPQAAPAPKVEAPPAPKPEPELPAPPPEPLLASHASQAPAPARRPVSVPPVRPAVTPPTPTAPKSFTPPAKPKPKRNLKWLLVILIVVLLLAGGAAAYWFVVKPRLHKAKPAAAVSTDSSSKSASQPAQTIRLIATGDFIAYDSINSAAKQSDGSYNYVPMMSGMKSYFAKGDANFCSEGNPAAGSAVGISGSPSFNAPTQFADGMQQVGCNLIDLANREMGDKGQPGVDGTLSTWAKEPNILAVTGANSSADQQNNIQYFTVKGMKFAFLAYTTSLTTKAANPYSVNMYSDDLAASQLKAAKANSDMIIVSMDWGTDYSASETSQQTTIAQTLANDGAGIILGHGPHVLEPAQVLNGQNGHQTLVWYSLGNALNSQVPVEALIGGLASMEINSQTQIITKVTFLPTYMHYEWTAQQKQQQSAADLAARHNFQWVPLDQAADLLAKSQNNTTVQAQQDRIKGILDKYLPVGIVTSDQF